MNIGRVISIVCGIAAALLAAESGASTINQLFDFSAPFLTEENVEGMAIGASGGGALTVTPTGGLINGTASENSAVDVIRGDWGLGLLNSNVSAGDDRSRLFRRIHVDGSNQPEVLRLEFSDAVHIDELFFAYVGPFESFDLAVDGVDINIPLALGTSEIYRMAPKGTAPGTVILPDTLPFGKVWEFFARSAYDEWNIEGLAVSAVPEPSTAVGLIALAFVGCGAGVTRRRRTRNHGEPARSVAG